MKQDLYAECSGQEFLAPWPPALAPEVVAAHGSQAASPSPAPKAGVLLRENVRGGPCQMCSFCFWWHLLLPLGVLASLLSSLPQRPVGALLPGSIWEHPPWESGRLLPSKRLSGWGSCGAEIN